MSCKLVGLGLVCEYVEEVVGFPWDLCAYYSLHELGCLRVGFVLFFDV